MDRKNGKRSGKRVLNDLPTRNGQGVRGGFYNPKEIGGRQ